VEPELVQPYGAILQRDSGQHYDRFGQEVEVERQTGSLTSAGDQFPMFVAAEFYKSSTMNNPKHVTKAGETLAGGESVWMAERQ
jgi:hypothetical protein